MSLVLLIGDDGELTRLCAQALGVLDTPVAIMAPGLRSEFTSAHQRVITENPYSTVGRGRIGDLIRQKAPISLAVQVIPEMTLEPFVSSSLSEDLMATQVLSTYLVLAKGLLTQPAAAVPSLAVIHSERTASGPHGMGIDGFLKGFSPALSAVSAGGGLRQDHVTLSPENAGVQQLAAVLRRCIAGNG